MKVKVLRKGFYDGNLYYPGSHIELKSASELGSWMEEVKPKAKPKPEAAIKPKANKPKAGKPLEAVKKVKQSSPLLR